MDQANRDQDPRNLLRHPEDSGNQKVLFTSLLTRVILNQIHLFFSDGKTYYGRVLRKKINKKMSEQCEICNQAGCDYYKHFPEVPIFSPHQIKRKEKIPSWETTINELYLLRKMCPDIYQQRTTISVDEKLLGELQEHIHSLPIYEPSNSLNNRVSLIAYDISLVEADVIVNATNPNLLPRGSGVNYSVYSHAGNQLEAYIYKTYYHNNSNNDNINMHGNVPTFNIHEEDMCDDLTQCQTTTTLSPPHYDITIDDHSNINNNNNTDDGSGSGNADHHSGRVICQTGDMIVTEGYLLPCKYIYHTVGPRLKEPVELLEKCYQKCLETAAHSDDVQSIAFCCISTGSFNFPPILAASTALRTTRLFLESNDSLKSVIFVVKEPRDQEIYESLMQLYFPIDLSGLQNHPNFKQK